jgi:Fe-S oxidoreductase
MSAKKDENEIFRCYQCGLCKGICPIFELSGKEPMSPRGMMALCQSVATGRIAPSKKFAEIFFDCTMCRGCTILCSMGLDIPNIIENMRSNLVDTGVITGKVKQTLENLMKYHNPIGLHPTKRDKWTEKINFKKFTSVERSQVLLFVCCLSAYHLRAQEIAKSVASIFNRIGTNFATLGNEEWCCGDSALRLGEKGLFEDLAEHNISLFKNFAAKKIVTLSPHCFYIFKTEKPYINFDFNVQHYTQFIADNINNGQLKFSKTLKKKVTYHDPCFLGRYSGIYDAPRKILESINGLELIEMKRTKEQSFCCGGGGGRFWIEDSAFNERPSVNVVKEALDSGADIIATACPFCVVNLEDAVKTLDAERNIAVRDISELLLEVL